MRAGEHCKRRRRSWNNERLSVWFLLGSIVFFTRHQLNGKVLLAWVEEFIAAVESSGFIVVHIVTNKYFANKTAFQLQSCWLSTTVSQPWDDRVSFFSFDPWHILRSRRTKQQNLLEILMLKQVYLSNLEKMNLLRATQVFSPQVIAASAS